MSKQQLYYLLIAAVISTFLTGMVALNMSFKPQGSSLPIVVAEPTGMVVVEGQQNAKLVISPVNTTLRAGQKETMQVAIVIPAGTRLDGADAVIRYDAQAIKISDVTNGGYFSQLPLTKVDQQNGTIRVTGFSRVPETTSPRFFSFVVTALEAGQTRIQVAHEAGRSDLSTLVESGTSKNILTSGEDAMVNVVE